MPEADVSATYSTIVAASATAVYDALLDTDFGSHPLVAFLMALRMLPRHVLAPRATWRRVRSAGSRPRLSLRALLNGGFVLLQELPPEELVLGVTGRFWSPSGTLVHTDPATFRDLPPTGLARAAWNFQLEPLAPELTRLSTETRVRCSDPATLRIFRRYWRIVAPGSGLIRWAILRRIKQAAEANVV